MNISTILAQSARSYGQAPALSMKIGYRTRVFSYEQVYKKARQFALYLKSRGVQSGDNVLLMAANSPYWVLSYWATILNNAVIVPLNVQMTQATIKSIIQQTQAKIIIASSRQELSADTLGDCSVLHIEDFEEVKAPFSATSFVPQSTCDDDLVQIMYTSGTTGDPKGVMMTHKNMSVVLSELARIIQLKPNSDTLISILPLSHIFEQVIGMMFPLYLGVHIIYPHSRSALVQIMRDYKVSKIVTVPEFLHLFMARMKHEFEEKNLDKLFDALRRVSRKFNNKVFARLLFYPVLKKLGGRLNTVASAGAPLEQELEQEWEDLGIIVLQGYGMTEACPLVATNTFEDRKFGSVGKACSIVDLKIADDGEILIKGENVFKGYYKNPVLTAASFTHDGWFKTGDMGELDSDGFLYLKGRKKYMILTAGGQNVFPEDIEAALNAQEGVLDSCVYGNEIAPGVTEIVAVCLLADTAPSLEDIVMRANNALASYQHINNWYVWPEKDFPRSAIRKVKKEEVKKIIKELAGQDWTKRPMQLQASTLQKIVSQVTGMPVESVTPQALLVKDLKLDSLTRIELVARIEEDLGKAVSESAITQKTTVNELQQLVDTAPAQLKKRTLSRWPRSSWARFARPVVQQLFISVIRPRLTLKVSGLEHLATLKTPVLFMPNHVTLLDSLLVAWALPRYWRSWLSFAAGEDVLYESYKKFAPLVELAFNAFPLPRKETGDIQFGLSNIGQMLDSGYSVVIFPEGKMSESGELLPLKDGAGLVAIAMDVPVVPVKLKKVRSFVGYNKMWPHASGEVEVVFGAPMYFSNKTTIDQAKKEIFEALASL